LKKTPLYEEHVALGGRIVDFGGWALPVQYSGILEEHLTVRKTAGLFDVSHMGEFLLEGEKATEYLQHLLTNDFAQMPSGKVTYSPMCYPDGGVVDDLLVYKFDDRKYWLVVNASNTQKDWEWCNAQNEQGVVLTNLSDSVAEIALQGPAAQDILSKLTNTDLDALKFYHFDPRVEICGFRVLLSRTGYTGEDGFELYTDNENAVRLWRELMKAGQEWGIKPVGLGARDTLRFEAGMPLYGQELSTQINPLAAGLGSFVREDKPDYIGKSALVQIRSQGVKQKIVGFDMIDRGLARNHYEVFSKGSKIGFVTTGSYAPSLGKNMGMAFIDVAYATVGQEIEIMIRDKAVLAKVIKRPFYPNNYKK